MMDCTISFTSLLYPPGALGGRLRGMRDWLSLRMVDWGKVFVRNVFLPAFHRDDTEQSVSSLFVILIFVM